MKGRFLMSLREDATEVNIYADKSALILVWLLSEGVNRAGFSLREVAKEAGVSLGLAQKVFSILVWKGFLQVEGVRTAKKFFFNKPKALLDSWIESYSIVQKCKMWTYTSAFADKAELIQILAKSKSNSKVALALHSAAEVQGYKNTNLSALELYVLDASVRSGLETLLQLKPKERGYEVLLLEPYYSGLLKQGNSSKEGIKICPPLLTFLDLYHFPLRGREQAEFIQRKLPYEWLKLEKKEAFRS